VPKDERKWTIRYQIVHRGRGIRIRTLNDGVRVSKSLFETHHFKPYF